MEKVFYALIIITAAVFVFSLISFCVIQRKRSFKCPNCGYTYKPGGVTAFFARKDDRLNRLLWCPACGRREYMENIKDEDKNDLQ